MQPDYTAIEDRILAHMEHERRQQRFIADQVIDEACAITAWGRAIGERGKDGGVAGSGVVAVKRDLYSEDDRNVVLAGVRSGVYTIERVGKRPVVRAPRDEEAH